MEAYCGRGHRWPVADGPLGDGEARGVLRCPTCGEAAVVMERHDGMEIDFAVPSDVRPVASVVLADEQERRREELARRVGSVPDFAVKGHAADGTDALELAVLLRPDVVVVADRMPRLDGLAAVPLLREAAPDAVIVYYGAGLDGGRTRIACLRGADACIDEAGVYAELVPTLRRLVHRGHSAHPSVRLPAFDVSSGG